MKSISTLSLFMCCLFFMHTISAQTVISEFHYDNSGTDVNERVEIFGKGGTDLNGYAIYLYDEDGDVYKNVLLSGVIENMVPKPGPIAFVGVKVFDIANIRNDKGAIALVDKAGFVLDFIHYGGGKKIIADEGPAKGQTANKINVEENNSTPANFSLWRPNAATDNFSGPALSSFGIVNTQLVPIIIKQFHVSLKDKVVDIKWTASNTHPDSYYEVERSTDQKNFEKLTKIRAAGTGEFSYSFRDMKPVRGNAFYRLKLLDPESYTKYSTISRIRWADKSLFINNVYPTRSSTNVQVQINSDRRYPATLEVLDFAGRLVKKSSLQIVEGNVNYSIPVSDFKSGSYLFRINIGSEMLTGKFIRE